VKRSKFILIVAIASWLLAPLTPANAQEDSAEDHGSRAVGKTSPKKPRRSKGKKHKQTPPFELGYELGAFGGSYLQAGAFGPLFNASLSGKANLAKHELSLDLGYGYDTFSTKTFNFPEEETVASDKRLTQPMHELSASLRHTRHWLRWFETTTRLRGDWWLPSQPVDERRSLRLEPELRFGNATGIYGSVAADGFLKHFPNYEIQGRRLDQRGVDGTLELGYVFSPYNTIAVGAALDYTEYRDAHYEQLTATGLLERSPRSKRYFERSPFIQGSIRPAKQFRADLKYAFELNDSIDYDRGMTGRSNGVLVEKFIRDYYDYRRHRVTLNTHTNLAKRFTLGTMSEVWFRDFDSYEARDVDNNWTGDLRHDSSLELGLEAAYRVWQFPALGLEHGVFISAFGAHLRRRSNMQREVSIATNFDVTRVFVGVEVKDL
jgi:hypothetical protein